MSIQVPHAFKWAVTTGLLSAKRFSGLHPWLSVSTSPVAESLDLMSADNEAVFLKFAGKFDNPHFPTEAAYFAFFAGSTEQVFVMCKGGHTYRRWQVYQKFPTFWDWYRWAIDDVVEWQKLAEEVHQVIDGKA